MEAYGQDFSLLCSWRNCMLTIKEPLYKKPSYIPAAKKYDIHTIRIYTTERNIQYKPKNE